MIVCGCFTLVVEPEPRMYEWHILPIPGLTAVLIGANLALIWRQLHTSYPGKGRNDAPIVGSWLWPTYTIKSIGLFLAVFALLAMPGGWAHIDPIWVCVPYMPDVRYHYSGPYLRFVFGFKLHDSRETTASEASTSQLGEFTEIGAHRRCVGGAWAPEEC
jgi:hypothetical protein